MRLDSPLLSQFSLSPVRPSPPGPRRTPNPEPRNNKTPTGLGGGNLNSTSYVVLDVAAEHRGDPSVEPVFMVLKKFGRLPSISPLSRGPVF